MARALLYASRDGAARDSHGCGQRKESMNRTCYEPRACKGFGGDPPARGERQARWPEVVLPECALEVWIPSDLSKPADEKKDTETYDDNVQHQQCPGSQQWQPQSSH